MRNIILLTVIASLLFGCISQEEKKKQEEEQHRRQKAAEREKVISNLVTKYNITFEWDTLRYNYSINYKPVIESKCQLIEDHEVIDIYTKDSCEFVSLKSGDYPEFYFDFPITKEQESIFLNGHHLLLIVSISQIRKLGNFDPLTDFIGKGKIVDIISTTK